MDESDSKFETEVQEDVFHDCVDQLLEADAVDNIKQLNLDIGSSDSLKTIPSQIQNPEKDSVGDSDDVTKKDENSKPISVSDTFSTSDVTDGSMNEVLEEAHVSDQHDSESLSEGLENNPLGSGEKLIGNASSSVKITESVIPVKNSGDGSNESEDTKSGDFTESLNTNPSSDDIVEAATAVNESSDDESEDESHLTETEIEERTSEAKKLKEQGNLKYKNEQFEEARLIYSEGIKICPKCSKKDRAVLFSNRSACLVKLDKIDEAIEDCTEAVSFHPQYLKAHLRRAQLYEKQEKFEEAMKDYEQVLKLDNSVHSAREALMRLPEEIEKRNEKMKQQMMSSLKDLGNLFLRPFGLSTDNFQMQQDPGSGSYNIQFNNNPGRPNPSGNGPAN